MNIIDLLSENVLEMFYLASKLKFDLFTLLYCNVVWKNVF